MNTFVAPEVDWAALTPVLILLLAAVAGVLVEAFVPARSRRVTQLVLGLVATAGALVAVVWRWTVVADTGPRAVMGGSVVEDGPALAAQGVLMLLGFLALLVIADRTESGEGAFAAQAAARPGSADEADYTRAGVVQTEVFPLTLFSLTGMAVFPAAGDLLTLFVALEVLSLPLYVLTGLARRRRLLSQEASLKYLLLGAFASASMIFGVALLYGFSGSVRLADLAQAVPATVGMDWMLLAGTVLVLVGLLFKIAAVPFHAWTPDVYTGAPTPITGFMAAATKLAAFAALLRFLYVAVPGMSWDLSPFLWTVIILTMLVGTVLGIIQTDVKRMLAYSAIAHAGFVLIGVIALRQAGIAAVLFYLLAYGLATIGAFALVTLVRERDPAGNVTGEATHLSQWAGLGRRKPAAAVAMTLFLLSMAGIPLTAGFMGKFAVFTAGVDGGEWILVVLAVLASAATAFFYVRLIVLMFFTEPDGETTAVVSSEGLTTVAVAVCAVGTLALGVLPGPVLDLAGQAAVFLP
ncbi:NADH-quinone oxidoreductase subunit NuoN [Georgenia sp. TF02-10]|uniref:NADH-quinone oxidoreductase subunit NuoN n=1 Tax=Georgenia sp. TF02-10 TaxID=2917725 RepID=UPI001FA7F526|nr:NADH-quinone oxidoreductase subunit NuoN [Georgenia sp. TF02-10]UNX54407.1 NADH-quinone oxidoreductase subunit NuoN [Georgenia sp. TF02-10]